MRVLWAVRRTAIFLFVLAVVVWLSVYGLSDSVLGWRDDALTRFIQDVAQLIGAIALGVLGLFVLLYVVIPERSITAARHAGFCLLVAGANVYAAMEKPLDVSTTAAEAAAVLGVGFLLFSSLLSWLIRSVKRWRSLAKEEAAWRTDPYAPAVISTDRWRR